MRIDARIDDGDDPCSRHARRVALGNANGARGRLVGVSGPDLIAEVTDESAVGQRGLDFRRGLVQIDSSKLGRDDDTVFFEPCDLGVALDIREQLLEQSSVSWPKPRAEARGSADE